MDVDIEVFDGGTMGGAVRVGDTVRRPAGPWSPTIQRLLGHLREQGATWAPEPLGLDEEGRDNVAFMPGMVPQYPLPEWVWSDAVLLRAVQYLGELHEASRTFDTAGATWQLPAHEPAEVICHNDFAPYNMVFHDGRLRAVIDWDTASPGPRVWDLAYLAYRLVPLTGGDAGTERARRLRLLCRAYGHRVEPADLLPVVVRRLHDLADFSEARATDDRPELRDHADLYRRDAAWIGSLSSGAAVGAQPGPQQQDAERDQGRLEGEGDGQAVPVGEAAEQVRGSGGDQAQYHL